MADSNWEAKTESYSNAFSGSQSESGWNSEAQRGSYQGWEEKTSWEAGSAQKPSAAHGPEPAPQQQWKQTQWVAAAGSASGQPPSQAASGQQIPAKAPPGKTAQPPNTASYWEEVEPIANEWWYQQNRLADQHDCKRLSEDERVCELWQLLTTEQIAYIVGGGDLLRGFPERDRAGKSQTAAKFMSRVSKFKQDFPDLPQINKGKQKGKRKSDWENSWKAKIMKTEVGQRIHESLQAKGKLKGKGGKKGKGKDDSGGKGKYGPPGTENRPPPPAGPPPASALVGREKV